MAPPGDPKVRAAAFPSPKGKTEASAVMGRGSETKDRVRVQIVTSNRTREPGSPGHRETVIMVGLGSLEPAQLPPSKLPVCGEQPTT